MFQYGSSVYSRKYTFCLLPSAFCLSPMPDLAPTPTWLAVIKLLRWDKPEGRLILMLPALWATVLATAGRPPLLLLAIIVAGSLATSAAGCVVNDLWDRNIDPQVERTRSRPLAAKTLSVTVGLGVAVVAFACAFGLSLYLTPLSFGLCVAAVPVIALYPLAKRVFPVPQLVLAIAWGFAVLISWTAAQGALNPATWALWGAVLLWTLGFDTVYAMPDRADDRRLGVNSSALFFGDWTATAVAVCYAGTGALLAVAGGLLHLGLGYWLALGIGVCLWGNQSWQLRQTDLASTVYGEFFRQNVWIGAVILAGMELGSLFA
jgi:4-hydroxybenzoate polyprenyltransferase